MKIIIRKIVKFTILTVCAVICTAVAVVSGIKLPLPPP